MIDAGVLKQQILYGSSVLFEKCYSNL